MSGVSMSSAGSALRARTTLLMLLAGLASFAAACGGRHVSSEASALRICGVGFARGAASLGGHVYGLTPNSGQVSIRAPFSVGSGQTFLVRLADNCEHGAQYTIRPAGRLTVIKVVRTKDHGVAGLALKPRKSGQSVVTAKAHGSVLGYFVLDLYS